MHDACSWFYWDLILKCMLFENIYTQKKKGRLQRSLGQNLFKRYTFIPKV